MHGRLEKVTAAFLGLTVAYLATHQSEGEAVAQLARAPNVLIILTDDQRATGTMGVMPETRRVFKRNGTRFTRAFATTPLCCPSRASIFTGRYAHNHGVKNNDSVASLDHRSTLQRYLKHAGYRTGIFGKFLNSSPMKTDPPYSTTGLSFRTVTCLPRIGMERQRLRPSRFNLFHRLHSRSSGSVPQKFRDA